MRFKRRGREGRKRPRFLLKQIILVEIKIYLIEGARQLKTNRGT